ncbi:hypothetical protein N0V88_002456 [Collariella sp. IMI 366227]|nr:hypothetical protein N0V88_002456 [Collariella sp. IMI 366227]
MRQVVCEAHLQDLSKTDRNRDAVRPNGTATHAVTAPKGTSSTSHRPDAVTNHRKLLSETDKGRPIMRRKTAGNPPLFKPQQPISKESTASPRVELSISPRSPRGIVSRPLVFSLPASPELNGEPARKRQKLSPPPRRAKEKNKAGWPDESAIRPPSLESVIAAGG